MLPCSGACMINMSLVYSKVLGLSFSFRVGVSLQFSSQSKRDAEGLKAYGTTIEQVAAKT